jgi:acetyltransferase-like isoleucine patch superfamily enzyme
MSNWWSLLRYDWPLHFVLLLTNWLPDNVFFLRLRGALSRLFLGSCGPILNIGRNVTFHNPSLIQFGNFIHISYGCIFMATDHIWIDDEVMFGPYCVVVSGKHTRANGSYRFGSMELSPIHIGKGVWFGAHVVVTDGSVIGNSSLIAAGAVVRGEIPENVVAGGVPARIVKTANE